MVTNHPSTSGCEDWSDFDYFQVVRKPFRAEGEPNDGCHCVCGGGGREGAACVCVKLCAQGYVSKAYVKGESLCGWKM